MPGDIGDPGDGEISIPLDTSAPGDEYVDAWRGDGNYYAEPAVQKWPPNLTLSRPPWHSFWKMLGWSCLSSLLVSDDFAMDLRDECPTVNLSSAAMEKQFTHYCK